jgi:hypothetical protein
VTRGEVIHFTATATDLDQTLGELVFYLSEETNVPGSAAQPKISFAGDFEWTADVTGTFTITVIVSDGAGSIAQQDFMITVSDMEGAANIAAIDIAMASR